MSMPLGISLNMPNDYRVLDDHDLAVLCHQRGKEDERLFAELFRRHHRFVWAVCRRYFRSSEDVADMSQVVFLRVFRNVDGFSGGRSESFRAWLAQVAVNICKNEIRSRSRRPQHQQTSLDSATLIASEDPLRHAMDADRSTRLYLALQELSPAHREIIELADIQEIPYPEIASQLKVSLSAIKMRVLRARAQLALVIRRLHSGEENDPKT